MNCIVCGSWFASVIHDGACPTCSRAMKQLGLNWSLMLKWDADSPVSFHADRHTVHDFEQRFRLEDDGLISADDKVFRWSMLDSELNYRLF